MFWGVTLVPKIHKIPCPHIKTDDAYSLKDGWYVC